MYCSAGMFLISLQAHYSEIQRGPGICRLTRSPKLRGRSLLAERTRHEVISSGRGKNISRQSVGQRVEFGFLAFPQSGFQRNTVADILDVLQSG